MAREKVTVAYQNATTVNLVRDDGSIYLCLHKGDEFFIGNQMRPYRVKQVPKRNGRGTILVCTKYADDGTELDSFALPNHKTGLWATTSGSARNGVFHKYHEPEDAVQKLCIALGVPGAARKVNTIDEKYYSRFWNEWEQYDGKGEYDRNSGPDTHVTGGTYLFLKREEEKTWGGGKETPEMTFRAYYTEAGIPTILGCLNSILG